VQVSVEEMAGASHVLVLEEVVLEEVVWLKLALGELTLDDPKDWKEAWLGRFPSSLEAQSPYLMVWKKKEEEVEEL
jgi:hypothetical protein